MNIKDTIKRAEIESIEKWRDVVSEIPTLKFKEQWEVKIIPPFSGAVARFMIEKQGKHICSIYLDWYERLGIYGEPYYELLYPFEDDVKRYSLKETDELLKDIDNIFNNA